MGFLDLISIIPNAFRTVDNITNAIANGAVTERDRIQSEEKIKSLTARRDVLISEAGVSRLNIFMRSAMAMSVVVVLAKLLIWDKVIGSLVGCSAAPRGTCGLFTTDPLDDNQWRIIMVVVGFYFVAEITASAARAMRR